MWRPLAALLIFAAAFFIFQRDAATRPFKAEQSRPTRPEPQKIIASRFAESGPVGRLNSPVATATDRSRDLGLRGENHLAVAAGDTDAGVARLGGPPMPPPMLSFDGLSNRDNTVAYELLFTPADMIGDVGPSHYVQAVNVLFRVFSKAGTPLTQAIPLPALFAPLNTPCSTSIDGQPNVVYDPLADRWLLSTPCFAFPPFRQLIAISKSGDPTGGYYLYEFIMPSVRFNDFPKLGVWPDAYYMATNEIFGSDYVGTGAFAFERAKMLAGDPSASYIYFRTVNPAPFPRSAMLPSDLDGLRPPPAGAPNTFASYTATEYGDAADAVRLFDFHVDFAVPANSTFTERPESPIAVAAFDPTSPSGRPDIFQPPPGEKLDSGSDAPNYRLAYRNFGDHEGLVFNQTVRTSPPEAMYRAGVRLYELRRSGSSYSMFHQATLGDNVISRWIPAAAQDHQGNLAVEYNIGSENSRPSIFYTGRATSDPPGQFRSETPLVVGTGVQRGFGYRWGEYSGLSVDPVDDCTFWATNGYYSQESQDFSEFGWLTRIGTFKFGECTPAPRASVAGLVTDAFTGRPIGGALVATSAYSRMTDRRGNYGPMLAMPGSFTVTASAPGYRSRSEVITLAAGENAARSFALEPVPAIVDAGRAITAESCAPDHAPEPGENITLELALRNTGAAAAGNLTARLLGIGGVVQPGPQQNYGTLPAGGQPVVRAFTFRIAPGIACGAEISLVFQLADGVNDLGQIVLPMRAGSRRTVFTENFDGVSMPGLPAGWSSTATPNSVLWTTSDARRETLPNSVYTSTPIQPGLNELVSPSIHIGTVDAELSFRNWYDLESTFLRNRLFDGSVLELRYDGGDWNDILAAGGSFISGGYEGTIDACCQNPLAGRLGWAGKSGTNQASEFVTTRVRLPVGAAGRDVQFRWRMGTDIGGFREGQYIDNLAVTDGYSCTCGGAAGSAPFDFDGDHKTDLAVHMIGDDEGVPDFSVQRSSDSVIINSSWGITNDVPVNSDFDGDGKTDIAVFRRLTSTWYIIRSSDSVISAINFGALGDIATPADLDGDGASNLAVFRPTQGDWFVRNQADGGYATYRFGAAGDSLVPEDYDGDGRADVAVYRGATGTWYIVRSSDSGILVREFGVPGDRAVAGDFDGDGRADLNIFRPSEGRWYFLATTAGFYSVALGAAGDIPLQADFDADGRADAAVFRPSTRVWSYIRSLDSTLVQRQFGAPGSLPVPGIFIR
jgi:hypothetical protein